MDRTRPKLCFRTCKRDAIWDELVVNHGELSPQKAINTHTIQPAEMLSISMPFRGQYLERVKDTRCGFK